LQAGTEGGEIACSNCMRVKNCRQVHCIPHLTGGETAVATEDQENNMRHLRGGEIEGRT
jgi:hypothetical protein